LNASIEWFDLALDAYANNMFFDDKSSFMELMRNKLNGFRYYTQANAAADNYDDKTKAEIARVNNRAEVLLAS
jgi:hypothetical protein